MTMKFSELFNTFDSKPNFWLKVEGPSLAFVPKQNGQTEIQQVSYGAWRGWGFGSYGCLTITRTIQRLAEKEIDSLIEVNTGYSERKQDQFNLFDSNEVSEALQAMDRWSQIQTIEQKQNQLIRKVQQKFFSHYGWLGRSCGIWGLRSVRFIMNIPSSIMNLFSRQVQIRSHMKKVDLNLRFMGFIQGYSQQLSDLSLWTGENGERITIHLITLPNVQIALFRKNNIVIVQGDFWIEAKKLQIKLVEQEHDEKSLALALRFFTNLSKEVQLPLAEPFPAHEGNFTWQNVRVEELRFYPKHQCLDQMIVGAHKIAKLEHLISLATIFKVAENLNAQNG
ncbi:MAG: hypothetical protein JSR58_08210 [Verrucomicrobia bacterium]|nr:hypothetical protein [Verrucomicrobiota bacterium]